MPPATSCTPDQCGSAFYPPGWLSSCYSKSIRSQHADGPDDSDLVDSTVLSALHAREVFQSGIRIVLRRDPWELTPTNTQIFP